MQLATTDVFKQLQKTNTSLHILTDKEIKSVQKIELETLDDILDICNQYKINYHLTGGTALGAVRHHGFIPWDDDIDIDMQRKDIDRFLNEFKNKYGEKYWIHDSKTCGIHCMPMIHIRRKGTVFQGCGDPTPEECGVVVDILPIENTYNNRLIRAIHGTISMVLGLAVSCRRFYMNRDYMLKLAGDDQDALESFKMKIKIGHILSFFSLERWVQLYDKWNSMCHNENSRYVTVATGKEKYFKATYLRTDFIEYIEGTFEGRSIKLPKKIDKYLTHMFGNYMKIPPKEEQEQHALCALSLSGVK